MSGSHWNYQESHDSELADTMESDFEYDKTYLDKDSQLIYQQTFNLLKVAAIQIHRLDRLISGDEGQDDFHEKLKYDLEHMK